MALVELRQCTMQHGFADDELTDEIHDCVNASSIDAENAFGDSSDGRGSASFDRSGRFLMFAGRSDFGRLSFEQITKQLVIGGVCGGSALYPYFRNNGRNSAALL